MRNRADFTKHQIETAIRVLMQSRIVRNWVKSEAELFGVDLSTPEGQQFYERNARAYAKKLIK